MTREQRRHGRRACELPAEVSFANELLIGETVELSLGGVRVVVDDLLAIGSTVRLTLAVPRESSADEDGRDEDDPVDDDDGEAFESSMTVRWTRARPDGRCVIGLSFGPLTAAERKDLARLIERIG